MGERYGLIKDLQNHSEEDGDAYLQHQQTYILIGKTPPKKDATTSEDTTSRSDTPSSVSSRPGDLSHGADIQRTPRENSQLFKAKTPSVTPDSTRGTVSSSMRKKREEAILKEYTPLLENLAGIFPYFKLRLSEDGKQRRKRIRGIQQAGKLVMQEKKTRSRRQRSQSGD
ncbi:hypothetical protein BSL78_21344 [Apostichopus japonicus]|uniref:Uncharacterized protein n=1 Tax=Stichopus japonicus TaxID=307972 RepID=A0A2G8K1C3_STIJA|nr:hypothetical protein BSL78_21344 [Apostichopus japonicus]